MAAQPVMHQSMTKCRLFGGGNQFLGCGGIDLWLNGYCEGK